MAMQQPISRFPGSPLARSALWFGVASAGFVLYALTAQPGVGWQDSGMLQFRALTGDYTGSLGLALAHPLYIIIARLFLLLPFGAEWLRLSLCSGAGMAVTLANVAILGWMLTGRSWTGLLTAGMLAVMHTPWWLSTITEVYTWNAAFFSGELIALFSCLRRPSIQGFSGLFLLLGLNIGIHNLALLSVPVYAACMLVFIKGRRLEFAAVPAAAAACVCGAAPLAWLVMRTAMQTGDIQAAAASMLFSGYAGQVFNVRAGWGLMGVNAALSSLNFVHAGLFLGIVGWIQMRTTAGRQTAWPLFALLGLHGVFFLRYSVPDQFTFILPSLVLFSLGMAVGIDALARRTAARRNAVIAACLTSIVLMPLTYAVLPAAMNRLHISVKRDRVLPFRDEMRYWIVPWKHTERSAERFASAALSEAAPDGMIVCDSTSYYPLLLTRMTAPGAGGVALENHTAMAGRYGGNPAALEKLLSERPVFVVAPALNFIAEQHRTGFHWARQAGSVLFRLQKADEGGVQ